MSRSDNFNTIIICIVTVLVVLGGLVLGSSAIGASPVTSAPSSLPLVGTLEEDSLSWESEASDPAPSPIPAPSASSPLPATTQPPGVTEIKPMAVVPVKKEPIGKEINNKVSDNADIVEVSLKNTSEFLTRIETLEKRIVTLEKEVDKLRQDNAASKKASKAKKVSKVKKVRRKVKVSRKKAPEWVLKSARPGMAWVSKKGSSELHAVIVGEMLEGIGKINAIVKDSSGYWVVDGVSGRISQ
ncbi:MAG: hypothetical protein KAI76_02190 [Alphaproteobacteria bacterium]|nr:hypothetical protein [Alphaproteobacteria bacterium]